MLASGCKSEGSAAPLAGKPLTEAPLLLEL